MKNIDTHAANFAAFLESAIGNLVAQANEKGLTEEQTIAAVRATLLAELAR